MLLASGIPVVLQGGARMPIKYGITAHELFLALDLDLSRLSLSTVQQGFDQHGLALIHQPDHFKIAESLISYREELGKRPPVASLELLWTAHQGKHLLVSGFVHPPTESRAWDALKQAGESNFVTVKGLEGGTDLPIGRACITATVKSGESARKILHPRDHGCHEQDVEWSDLDTWVQQAQQALKNQGPLRSALRWNSGAYIWFSGRAKTLEDGIQHADRLLNEGKALDVLHQLAHWRKHLAMR